MRVKYDFAGTPELRALLVEVENRGDKIIFEVSGAGSELFGAVIRPYFEWMNRRGPIAVYEGSNVYSLCMPPIPSKAHARMVEGFLQTFVFRKRTPQALTLGVTDECQCRCVHCSAGQRRSPRPVLSLQELRRVVDESLALGVTNISFTGGEPLLREDLEDCVSAVPKEKAVVQVFTNAVDLDAKRAASLKAAGVWGLQVSLDSPDPGEHDRLRGRKGTFHAVERGVKAAREVGLLVALSTYVTDRCLKEDKLRGLATLAAHWGAQEISVSDVIPTGRLLRRDDLLLTENSRKMLLEQARLLNEEFKGRTRLLPVSWTNSGSGYFSKSLGCIAGNFQFHVTAVGDFTPCDFTPLSFGNVRSESIADLWKKLTEHSAYCRHQNACRMQTPDFRKKYIHTIPEGADLPFPIGQLDPVGGTSRSTPVVASENV